MKPNFMEASIKRLLQTSKGGTVEKEESSTLDSVLPRFKRFKLSEIALPTGGIASALQARFRHVTKHSPVLSEPTLGYLELVHPIILVKAETGQGYELVAGMRTWQLMSEHRNSSATCRAILLGDIGRKVKDDFHTVDTVIGTLVRQLEVHDVALIAHELSENKTLKSSAGKFMQLESKSDLADALGVGRTTLHKMVESIKSLEMAQSNKEVQGGAVHIDLLHSNLGDKDA